MLSALLVLTPITAFGVLDKTAEECHEQYGPPHTRARPIDIHSPNIRARYNYLWGDFYISASFARSDLGDTRCVSVRYEPQSWIVPKLAVPPVNAVRPGPIKKITAAEIEWILALNAGGSSWQRTRRGHAWMRRDKQAFAIEHEFGLPGSPCNTLLISHVARNPDLPAWVPADLPPE